MACGLRRREALTHRGWSSSAEAARAGCGLVSAREQRHSHRSAVLGGRTRSEPQVREGLLGGPSMLIRRRKGLGEPV